MAEHIDQFLNELKNELDRDLSYAERVDQLVELRLHLEEKRDALVEIGLSPTEAELEAIRSFGPPTIAAPPRPAWPQRFLVAGILVAAPTWLLTLLFAKSALGAAVAVGVIGFIAIPALWVPFRKLRVIFLPLLVTVAIYTAAHTAFLVEAGEPGFIVMTKSEATSTLAKGLPVESPQVLQARNRMKELWKRDPNYQETNRENYQRNRAFFAAARTVKQFENLTGSYEKAEIALSRTASDNAYRAVRFGFQGAFVLAMLAFGFSLAGTLLRLIARAFRLLPRIRIVIER